MVLADRRRDFVQEVLAGVSDSGVNFLDFALRLLPELLRSSLLNLTLRLMRRW